MEIYSDEADGDLMRFLPKIKERAHKYTAIYFNLSQLSENFKTEFQLKIAIKVVIDLLKHYYGGIFLLSNGDLVVVFDSTKQELASRIMFQVRYLFADDHLAYRLPNVENDKFCTIFYLHFEFKKFITKCNNIIGKYASKLKHQKFKDQIYQASLGLFIKDVEDLLPKIDIDKLLRKQIVAVSGDGKDFKPFCHEVFVSIKHLKEQLPSEEKLFREKLYTPFLFDHLDQYVLNYITDNLEDFYHTSICINLNMNSVFTDAFKKLDDSLTKDQKSQTVIEINIRDVFFDMQKYFKVRDYLNNMGYRVCLDGIDSLILGSLNCRNLKSDLVKIQWNHTLAGGIDEQDKHFIAEQIQTIGTNRIILCRCDDINAINYGMNLGIKIYQGWYLDKLF